MSKNKIATGLTKSFGKPSSLKFISTGCTLLNLAVSQRWDGGWARGRIVNLVGDGSSGKTLLALRACASVFYDVKDVKKKYIVYNNVEGVMDFDIALLFGQEFADAIIWESSSTCEKFGRNYMQWLQKLKKGEFLLYVGDSLDSMVSSKQKERTLESIKTDKDEKGSYGEKAKYFSASLFNNLCSMMQDKDATLICISQVREKINVMFGEKYYRAGGKALDFYTHQVVWLAEKNKMDKSYKGFKNIIGTRIKAYVKRNKVSKAFRRCDFRILFDYGIDDIESCIDFVYGEKDKGFFTWPLKEGKSLEFCREELVEYLENKPKAFQRLRQFVSDKWHKIERKTMPNRKPQFR